MLQTQVNYWNLKELERHNRAMEAYNVGTLNESVRHNLATEKVAQGSLDESVRHNLVNEQFNWSSLAETSRHNLAFEVETNRHNVATENENVRHNVATEQETSRHNRSEEGIGWYNAKTQRYVAESTARYQAVMGSAALTNAATNQRNADINQQNANTNKLKNLYYQDSVQAQVKYNQAQTDYTNAQTDYVSQKNVREWINTVGDSVGDLTDLLSAGSSFFSKLK